MAFDPYDFYKDMYEFEIDRMEKLNSNITTPITILVVLGGVLWFFLKDLKFQDSDPASIIFYGLVGIASATFLISIIFLMLSFHHPRYFLISDTKTIDGWEQSARKSVDNEESLNKLFETELREKFINASADNRGINDGKSAHLHNSKTFLIATLSAVFLSVIVYGIRNYSKPETIQKIQIVNSHTCK